MKSALIGSAITIVFLAALAIVYYLGQQNPSKTNNSPALQTADPSQTTNSNPPPTPKIIAAEPLSKSCVNDALGVEVSIPASWNCKTDELSKTDGTIQITSDKISLVLSNLGRGLYCDPNQDSNCKVTPFYEKPSFFLNSYFFEGMLKEIFGRGDFKINASIKLTDPNQPELTPEQKAEIISIFDSITKK